MAHRTIHADHTHTVWDRSLEPVVRVEPGEMLSFACRDASGGQLGPDSDESVLRDWNTDIVNPVTGPVFVESAEPGDALIIEILSLSPTEWGWTAILPGFGLLAEDFPEPKLHHWRCDPGSGFAQGRMGRIPMHPFPGTIGVAPAAAGAHPVLVPTRTGGNLDTRDIAEGAKLRLPVEVPGALFSIGDTHAAQGDGEVCGTAIESPIGVTLRFDLEKGDAPPQPRFETPGPVTRHLDGKGYDVTAGVGPDLMDAARTAVRGMVELLAAREGMHPADAYILCSVCGDLRITQLVDAPNWTVGFYFPRIVVE